MRVRETDQKYIANTYARFPLVLTGGKGSVVTDEDGREYIDMATGIAVNTFGIGDDEWVKAVSQQAAMLAHTSNLYYSLPDTRLAEMLCERTGMKRVFFSNSGAEANECVVKAARKYAAEHKGPEYSTIITLENSFHGRTLTTLAATGQEAFHDKFLPLTPGFVHVQANNIDDLRAKVHENKVAAILFEPVQGEGGVLPLEQAFVDEIARLAAEEDFLIAVDEVQTGNGRCGALYAYMNFGITPDIVSTAKGLAGGLPLGATLLGERVKDIFAPGDHGSTFGGNPVCCAAAVSILSRIDDILLNGVKERSDYIVQTLTERKGIKSVTGMGLMLGIETEKQAADVIAACRENGVLVISAKAKVRLLPALNIPFPLLKQAVEVIARVCE